MGFSKWLIQVLSYLLYSLAVLALMLWYQFPVASVKSRLEYELRGLTPELNWNIGKISLALPADIRLTDIMVSDNQNLQEPLFTVDSVAFRPALWAYLKDGKLAAGYRLGILDGSVNGHLSITDDHSGLLYDGKANGIKIAGLEKIIQDFDRTVSGTLSGSFTGTGTVRGSRKVELTGKINLVNGEISFKAPVLGMEKLAFTSLSSQLKYGAEGIGFNEGLVESRLLAADFEGVVKLVDDVGRSTLQLNGALTPRPEFLSTIGDGAKVNIIKRQLQDGKLPFVINGTLKEPGIAFTGLPANLNQQLRGAVK